MIKQKSIQSLESFVIVVTSTGFELFAVSPIFIALPVLLIKW
ncbi:MAG TPA: hypothetical protein VIS27_05690 [Yeosuana sp.]